MIKSKSWNEILNAEFKKDYFIKLEEFVRSELEKYTIYPPMDEVYTALEATDFEGVKVLILGQDPYHGHGQAHGLSFSVKSGVKIPPSLRNIYKELNTDLDISVSDSGNLEKWSKQGVLLLNTVLTVRDGEPNSHKNKGWEIFTDKIIQLLNEREKPMVFILWGNNAIQKKNIITNTHRHLIIESVHPSPLSARRGFFGSKPFSKTNEFLRQNKIEEIDWSIDKEQLSMF